MAGVTDLVLDSQHVSRLHERLLHTLTNPNALRELKVPTGVRSFDRIVCARRGQLVVVGAENGSGKSTYTLGLATSAARCGVPVALFSLEDTDLLLQARLLGLAAGVAPHRILDSQLDAEDMRRLRDAAVEGLELPLHVVEGEADARRIEHTIRDMAERDGVQLVIVDYLQQLSGHTAQDRRNEIRVAVQGLARLARKLRICLVLVSQVVRPQSREVGAEPNRHWLKEAGDIADAADKVLMLWREQRSDGGPTNLKLCKDKCGRFVGATWQMPFNPDTGWLMDVEY